MMPLLVPLMVILRWTLRCLRALVSNGQSLLSSDDSSDDVEEPLLSTSPSTEAPKNVGGSKCGPKSKAKKPVVSDSSSNNIEDFSLSALSGMQAPNVKNGGPQSAEK